MPNLHRTTGICYYTNIQHNTVSVVEIQAGRRDAYTIRARIGGVVFQEEFTRTSFFGSVGKLLLTRQIALHYNSRAELFKAATPFSQAGQVVRGAMRHPLLPRYHAPIPISAGRFHYEKKQPR